MKFCKISDTDFHYIVSEYGPILEEVQPQTDTKRLDWLLANAVIIYNCPEPTHDVTTREAIDKAMENE